MCIRDRPTKVQGTNQVVIKTRSLDLKEREALNKALEENFDVDTSLITSENISATVSNEMRRDAIVAVIVAAIFMLLYIWFRFKDIRFASSAVLALLHDVLVVLAFYVISRTSVGNTFIACIDVYKRQQQRNLLSAILQWKFFPQKYLIMLSDQNHFVRRCESAQDFVRTFVRFVSQKGN